MSYFGTIYADTELPSRARAVYMYLRDRSDAEGKCWPGIKTIASDMKLSRSTVKRAVSDLEKAGYLVKAPRYRPNGSSTSEVWKKFFPHETFVKLLKNTVSVLERKQKLCLWVEGAYGTGKSHAVHTLKKLLDSSEEETREYFQRHKMDNDLYNRFQAVKSSGRILTVHRYGSASIRSDHNLVFAIQESIEKALVDAGIENKGGNALKDATIAWLSDKDNKNYFNGLITGTYSDLFGGDDADTVIEKLRTFSGEALARIMDNIFKVADERQVKALSLSVTDLGNWIREVIRANSLKAIVFMWDEFTEYFYNNARNLTGFQELCEISETDPFYFVLVTHVTQGLFHERDQDFIKLNGRFVSPHSLISLPENIAFQLMGAAMEKNKDEVVLADWEVALGDLTDRTQASRKLVKSVARITDKEMIDILPIHPYAALLLKHISSAFDSNQRSMFDFIKNDRGDEIKGFQWFIDNFGPEDDNPLLSVDMLWEFFYDKGKEYLSHDIRSILDYYNRAGNQRLDSDQKRVLKTVLLLQAISQYAGDSVELFIPNEKNLDNAFEGTDMEGSAARCADQLVREKVLFSKSLGGGKFQYAAYNHENEIDVTPFEEQIDRKSTSAFITEELADRTRIVDAISLGGALKLRYELRYVSSSDFDSTIKQLRNTEEKYANKIVAPDTRLVSIMAANNEIGSIQDIPALAAIAHSVGAMFHTDAVQAVGHIKIDVNDLGVDMLSASAHKFHGPKGIGFLYVRKGTPLAPYASGGSQENHMRAGTENIASIVGMAAALKKCVDGLKDTAEHLTRLETKLIMGLSDANVRFSRNGSAAHIPGNISLSFPGYSGEALLHRLDLMGICVSTGSACNSRETQISHVLQAIKLEPELAKGTIRLSLGKNNTEGDIDEIVDALLRILK